VVDRATVRPPTQTTIPANSHKDALWIAGVTDERTPFPALPDGHELVRAGGCETVGGPR
jgi:hypothetical protein